MLKQYRLLIAFGVLALCLSTEQAAQAMPPTAATTNALIRAAPRPKGQMFDPGNLLQVLLNFFSF